MADEKAPNPPCPFCGHHTLYRPEGWVEGGPLVCANPLCESNFPESYSGEVRRRNIEEFEKEMYDPSRRIKRSKGD